jgi:hypothetical protein
MEIGYNEVHNEPYNSRVEDNINVYISSGTASSPLRIYGNFIRGGYPIKPDSMGYSGGGILIGDGGTSNGTVVPMWVNAYENVVVGTNNYGIAISAGKNMVMNQEPIIELSLFLIPLLAYL